MSVAACEGGTEPPLLLPRGRGRDGRAIRARGGAVRRNQSAQLVRTSRQGAGAGLGTDEEKLRGPVPTPGTAQEERQVGGLS